MIPPSRLFDIAQACLDAVVAHYASEGYDLPSRQYVANGLPAFDATEDGDCDEQVTVYVESTYGIAASPLIEAPEPLLPEAGHALRAGVFVITIVRCVPTIEEHGHGTIPTPADETASAQQIYEDAVLTLNALIAAERAGELPGCGSVVFLRWQNENAQGGVGGGSLRVAISLSDAF